MKISREAKEALARMVLELLVGNAIRLDRLSEDPSILCTGDNLHAIRKTRCVDSASWSRGSRCPKKTKRGRRQTSPFVGLRRGKGWPSVSPRRWPPQRGQPELAADRPRDMRETRRRQPWERNEACREGMA